MRFITLRLVRVLYVSYNDIKQLTFSNKVIVCNQFAFDSPHCICIQNQPTLNLLKKQKIVPFLLKMRVEVFDFGYPQNADC